MEPLHFGPQGRLFGLRTEPVGPARQTAVLICSSWGMEYMRSYRFLHLLSVQLSRKGFDVLRFDYSCTGDSMGYSGEAAMEQWIEDISSAAHEIRDLSGAPKLCVLGLRLGALLAIEAVKQRLRPDGLGLWDLPSSGQAWLDELRELDSDMYMRKNRHLPSRFLLAKESNELLGAPWNSQLNDAIAGLSVPPDGLAPQTMMLNSPDTRPVPIAAATRVALPDESYWAEPAWLTTPWAPANTARAICDAFDQWP